MDMPVAAELHIARETSTTYRVLYRRRSEPRGPSRRGACTAADTLQVFLQQFESAGKVDSILTRVEAGISHVLDLGYVDEERVARVFRQYAHSAVPAGASDALASADPGGPAPRKEPSASRRHWRHFWR